MSIITKKFLAEKIPTQSVFTVDEAGNKSGYKPGELQMEVPNLKLWSDSDLDAFAEWVAKQLIHYGPSSAYKGQHGDVTDSREGRFLVEDGVFKINPSYRPGQWSEEAFLKKIALTEAMLDRALTDDEMAVARAKAGLS